MLTACCKVVTWICDCWWSLGWSFVPERKLPHLRSAGEPLWPSPAGARRLLFSLLLASAKLKVRLSVAAARFKCGKSTGKGWVTEVPLKEKKVKHLGKSARSFLTFIPPFALVEVSVVGTSLVTNPSAWHKLFYFHLSLVTVSSESCFFFCPYGTFRWEQVLIPDVFCLYGEERSNDT